MGTFRLPDLYTVNAKQNVPMPSMPLKFAPVLPRAHTLNSTPFGITGY